jgi:hypothetical protein
MCIDRRCHVFFVFAHLSCPRRVLRAFNRVCARVCALQIANG